MQILTNVILERTWAEPIDADFPFDDDESESVIGVIAIVLALLVLAALVVIT